eukprot:938969-Alexandrium_andersonii.AAC.1
MGPYFGRAEVCCPVLSASFTKQAGSVWSFGMAPHRFLDSAAALLVQLMHLTADALLGKEVEPTVSGQPVTRSTSWNEFTQLVEKEARGAVMFPGAIYEKTAVVPGFSLAVIATVLPERVRLSPA